MDLCETSALPRNSNVEVQHMSSRGTQCKTRRGRKGDRCWCIYEASMHLSTGSAQRSGRGAAKRGEAVA